MIIPSPMNNKSPQIAKDAFIAPTATIIGDVIIKSGANIWFGAILRGDEGTLIIGENTSIQEHVAIHTEPGTTCEIGKNCIVGHHAMVHGPSKVGDNCMIGINAVVLADTQVGEGTIVAGGAVARKKIPELTLVAGVPAEFKKKLPTERLAESKKEALLYVDRGKKFIEKGHIHSEMKNFIA
jgi:carbonic anhydrase/acetyltransferase-like protein (isoleucine patch superfamily)